MSDTSDRMEFSPTSTSCRLRKTQRHRNRYLSSSQVATRDGRTFTLPQEFLHGTVSNKHTGHDQEKGGNDLEQDVEHPLSTEKQVTTEVVTPKKTPPPYHANN
ncbi:hypothetical protein TNCV_4788961 [Trichonephila clavipes]|nr:hypothetical protein TNCV_4788961 [Trichonephila clavipes]